MSILVHLLEEYAMTEQARLKTISEIASTIMALILTWQRIQMYLLADL